LSCLTRFLEHWPLPPAGGLSNNDVIALRPLRSLLCMRCVGWKPRFSW